MCSTPGVKIILQEGGPDTDADRQKLLSFEIQWIDHVIDPRRSIDHDQRA